MRTFVGISFISLAFALTALGCGDVLAVNPGGGAPPPPSEPKAQPKAASCPEAGETMPFGKVMNQAFAEGLASCRVGTEATFWSAEGGSFERLIQVPPNSMLFQVSDPAVGEGSYVPVMVKKADADPIFSMKKGDSVVLVGAPKTTPQMRMTHGFYFAAEKVKKGK